MRRLCRIAIFLRLPTHPTNTEITFHKYFSDTLGAKIATAGFVHSFTQGHDTAILSELLCSIKSSGLLDQLDRLFIVNCGDDAALPAGFDEHEGRVRLINFSNDASSGEKPTLDLIRTFASFHDDVSILYLHTKGASYAHASPNVADWRRFMLYFLVERHVDALAALVACDVVGCDLLEKPRRHFSGNFWWAHARYLKSLPPVPAPDRHEAEWWVLSGWDVRAESLHQSGKDHYREIYGRDEYVPADRAQTTGPRRSLEPSSSPRLVESDNASGSICLVMIAKNEAHIVLDALTSVLPYISDFIIVDTGSTDGTQDAIRGFFSARGISGHVFDRSWRDFGWNRTEALALARAHSTSDYLWMFDADDVLEGTPNLTGLSADAYNVRFGPDVEYWRPQIFRRTLQWKYVGVLHEYPACDGITRQLGHIEGDYRVLSRRLGSRSSGPRKYEQDAALLETALSIEPNNARHAFYLAQSWFDARQFKKALEAYRRRAEMGGWSEEVFYSNYRAAQCLQQLGAPYTEILAAYENCFRKLPHRAEPLVRAATLARQQDRFHDGYVMSRRATGVAKPDNTALFVENNDYEFRALDEQAIAAYYCGFPDEAFELCSKLLDHRALPDSDRSRIEKNRDYSVPHIKLALLRYDAELIANLSSRQPALTPRVTLAVTSCRRTRSFHWDGLFIYQCMQRPRSRRPIHLR